MEYEDCSSGCSSSNEQQPSPQTPPPALVLNSPRCSPPSTASSSPTDAPALSPAKRRAGRKKFRETRHPVYRGVRERNGGKWVCELREPQKKTRIWLGTYATPEMAARAHDVAAIALRGKSAPLNFADSARVLPRSRSTLPEDIRFAAARAADMFRPPSPAPCPSASSSRVRDPPVGTADRTWDGEGGVAAAGAASLSSSSIAPAEFVDEDALLNMAELVDDMARGLLMTPPARHGGFDCDDMESDADWSLWTD